MNVNRDAVRGFFDSLAGSWDADRAEEPEKIRAILRRAGIGPGVEVLDKTTPRLIQFHTLKNAVNPPFLGGFSIFNTVVA